jgi:hypothetical protein
MTLQSLVQNLGGHRNGSSWMTHCPVQARTQASVVDGIFEQTFFAICRLAAVPAAKTVTLYGLTAESRRDLEQEALLELWRKRPAYDPRRGSWRTFSERVVTKRMRSAVRSIYSSQSGHGKEDRLEGLQLSDPAPCAGIDLQNDVRRVLDGLSSFGRTVALSLIDYSAMETSKRCPANRRKARA